MPIPFYEKTFQVRLLERLFLWYRELEADLSDLSLISLSACWLECAVQISLQGTLHISFKIGIAIFQAPFKYISNDNHTDIRRYILQWIGQMDDACIESLFQIIVNCDDRIWAFGTDCRIQRLVFWCIIIGHKRQSQILAVMYIIQIKLN